MAELATVARPYADALFGLAKEQNKLESWLEALKLLAALTLDSKVAAALDAPETSAEDKAKLLLGLAGDMDTHMQNFVGAVAEGHRLALLPEIYDQYQAASLAHNKIKLATIYSAFAMDDEQFASVVADLQTRFGTKLQANLIINPDLIGGIKVEVGDQVLDLSVQGQLNTLYATMTN